MQYLSAQVSITEEHWSAMAPTHYADDVPLVTRGWTSSTLNEPNGDLRNRDGTSKAAKDVEASSK
jgi:hypothetical protein